ncbi:putative MybHv33 [Oryza sativa Japonica Group]|uniref:MybHv33 n=1 Tax=Oryza sativa subsp. japonica TaxID=39947 RepID=Q5VQF6_ORYSJ|nr:putative MybHv33 [Oryza sativa Japonica Group]
MVRKPTSSRNGEAAAAAAAGGAAEEKERKGLWSPEEDERLYTHITHRGLIARQVIWFLDLTRLALHSFHCAGLRRSGKSCRLRWMNYLRPDLKKEPISDREAETILSLQKLLGNRWSVIAAKMPGRTDNEIKNYWNSRIRKRQSAAAGAKGEPAPATVMEKEPTANAATVAAAPEAASPPPPPIPARLPMFSCQLLDGGGSGGATATTQSPPNAGSSDISEVSACGGNGGGEDSSRDYCFSGGDVDGDGDMVHLLALDDLDLLVDVPGLLDVDAWDCELYRADYSTSRAR